MIYLLITTCINNRYGDKDEDERRERYMYAIAETLKQLPHEIKPIIVENNGKRETYLDNFYHHHHQHVKVFYTENNKYQFKSKGINELLDIKEVIERYGIEDDDIIIKLTGRYRALSPELFTDVIKNENNTDIWMRFSKIIDKNNTIALESNYYDCILGCYAIRTKFLKLFNHLTIENYTSAEVAFAKYVRFCGARLKEIEHLDIECKFGENKHTLVV